MIAVPEKARTVKDLAEHVASILDLRSHGGGEVPQLIIGGFLVPHDEVVAGIFRDDEVVDVAPTLQHVAWVQQSMLALPAASGTNAVKRSDPEAAVGSDVNGAVGSARKKVRTAAPGAKDAPAMMALAWQSPAKPSAEPAPPKNDETPKATKETSTSKTSKPSNLRHGSRVRAGGVAGILNALRQESTAQPSDSDEEENARLTASVGKALAKAGGSEPSQKPDAVSAAKSAALNACDALLQVSAKRDTAVASKASPGAEDSAPDARGIFVGGLPRGGGADEASLKAFFSSYGQVEDVYVPKRDGEPRGFAFVQFEQKDSRDAALAAGDLNFHGTQINVKERTAKVGKNGKDGKGQGKGVDKAADTGKGKGSKDSKGKGKGKGKGTKAPVATTPLEVDEDEDEEDEEDEAPQKPHAKAAVARNPAGKGKDKKADSPEYAPAEESAGGVMGIVPQRWNQVQRQMAALGLPVSFVASAEHAGDNEEEEEEAKAVDEDEESSDDDDDDS